MGGVASVSEFKNQAPRVLRKVRGALGNTLVSFTNKTNNCLQMNILAWLEKLVARKLSIHKFSIRERERTWISYEKHGLKVRGKRILRGFVEGREEKIRVEEWVKRKGEGMGEQILKLKGSSSERGCLLSLDVSKYTETRFLEALEPSRSYPCGKLLSLATLYPSFLPYFTAIAGMRKKWMVCLGFVFGHVLETFLRYFLSCLGHSLRLKKWARVLRLPNSPKLPLLGSSVSFVNACNHPYHNPLSKPQTFAWLGLT
ncbi:unnamed protein product [Prunus armeniaca]